MFSLSKSDKYNLCSALFFKKTTLYLTSYITRMVNYYVILLLSGPMTVCQHVIGKKNINDMNKLKSNSMT